MSKIVNIYNSRYFNSTDEISAMIERLEILKETLPSDSAPIENELNTLHVSTILEWIINFSTNFCYDIKKRILLYFKEFFNIIHETSKYYVININ